MEVIENKKSTKKKSPSNSKKHTDTVVGVGKTKAISGENGIVEAIRTRRGPSWKLVLFFLFFFGIGMAYITWPKWNIDLPKRMLTVLGLNEGKDEAKILVSRVDKLAISIFELENFLDTINDELTKKSSKTTKSITTATKQFDGRLKILEEKFVDFVRLKTPKKNDISAENNNQSKEKFDFLSTENKKLQSLVKKLNIRLAALEARPVKFDGAAKSNALLLAIGQLREVMASSSSFQEPLQTVIALGRDINALKGPITILLEHAEKGVPEFAQLKISFGKIVAAVIRASNASKNHGWVDKALEKVKNLVTIRPIGPKAAERADLFGQVAGAELRMDAGDLKGAVKIVSALEEKIRKPAENWLALAKARLSVDLAISQLFAKALNLSKELVSGTK